jgi:hypothetical protein
MSGIAGASSVNITIVNVTHTNTRVGTAATAFYRLESDGDVVRSQLGAAGDSDIGDWIEPRSAAGGTYETKVTVNTGSLDAGTSGSWLALSSSREWSITQGSLGSKNVNFTVEIRQVGSSTTLKSATIDLTAEYA